jgi:hypothetical protein
VVRLLQLRFVISTAALVAAFAPIPVAADAPSAAVGETPGAPSFSSFPVRSLYSGPGPATLRFDSREDREYLKPLLTREVLTPNFAGQFRVVQFRTGTGPMGAVLVDSKTGKVFHLPYEIVGGGLFAGSTDCLSGLRRPGAGEREGSSRPFSFRLDSELMIVSQCRVSGGSVMAIDISYYRWHSRKWHLLQRNALAPPPLW